MTKEEGRARWASDEMRAAAASYTAAADPVRVQEGRAEADCIVRGNETTYGQLLPEASVTLELTRQADGRYRLTRVRTDARRPNGFFAVIDAAERYWELQGWD